MDISQQLPPGRYVLAVSGGVDSVVLLSMAHLLGDRVDGYFFVVAHFDHGIRDESAADAKWVDQLAKQYGYECVSKREVLGKSASEAFARERRYDFLQSVAERYDATVVTAHHRDDVLETCLIQLIRGTGWRGLAGLGDERFVRPLTGYDKVRIVRYAIDNGLQWREDETNDTADYLRNRVRAIVMPKLTAANREELYSKWLQQTRLRQQVDTEVASVLGAEAELSRHLIIMSPWPVAAELMRSWIRHKTGYILTRPRIDGLVLFARTARQGARTNPQGDIEILATKRSLIVVAQET